jgi:hypothetical protein
MKTSFSCSHFFALAVLGVLVLEAAGGLASRARGQPAEPVYEGNEARAVEIEQLIEVLTNNATFKDNPVLAADTIIRLGKLKAVAAIPLLVEHIDFRDPRADFALLPWPPTTINGRLIVNWRVAVEALVKIGKPSVEPVLQAARKEDRHFRQLLLAAVVRGIEGASGGQRLVEKAAAAAQDPRERQRLEELGRCIAPPKAPRT